MDRPENNPLAYDTIHVEHEDLTLWTYNIHHMSMC